jgi:hypothetical protein
MDSKHSSGLFYHGTTVDVQLGDVIIKKRFLRKGIEGVVAYIPGISPLNDELEYNGMKQWLMKMSDGTYRMAIYDPARCQPGKSIKFIRRGSPVDFTSRTKIY